MSPQPSKSGRPLRIAHLNSMLTGGGTDDQCIKLAHRLKLLGVSVWLAGPGKRELTPLVRELQIPFFTTPPEGPAKVRFILAVARLLRRERIQIVHGHHGRDLWPTILAARFSGVRPRIVLTRHLAKSPSSWASRRFLLGQCDAMIAVSHFVAQVLSQGSFEPNSPEPERRARPPLSGDHTRIRVIHGGIDTDRFRPLDGSAQRKAWGLAADHFAFGVVGGYDFPRGKGQREFLRAASKVHSQLPAARFLIVGRGQLKETLELDIEHLGLRGKAWLTEYCRDMPAAMNALDCLVHPQVGTEAFPGVVLEAFSCGKPIIASRLDGIPEAFSAGGVGQLVTPESLDQLAAAMLSQIKEPLLSPAQKQELHQKIDSGFSLDVPARKTLALYHELLAR